MIEILAYENIFCFAVLSSTRLGGSVARERDLRVFVERLPRHRVSTLFHVGGVVDPALDGTPEQLAGLVADKWPVVPGLKTINLVPSPPVQLPRLPIEAAMRDRGREDWVDIDSVDALPHAEIHHIPSGIRTPVELVFANPNPKPLPTPTPGKDQLVLIGGTRDDGFELAGPDRRQYVIHAGAFYGRRKSMIHVGGTIVNLRLGPKVEAVRANFWNFNVDK